MLVVAYLHDVAAVLQLRRLSDGGLERELALPGLGSVREFSGRREDSEAFFAYTDFVTPGSFYRWLPLQEFRQSILIAALSKTSRLIPHNKLIQIQRMQGTKH